MVILIHVIDLSIWDVDVDVSLGLSVAAGAVIERAGDPPDKWSKLRVRRAVTRQTRGSSRHDCC